MDLQNIDSIEYVNFDGHLSFIKIVKGYSICSVPIDPANSDYAEIMRQVEAGTLTIQDAD